MNSNNKRIVKNTLLLYVRMLLIMVVTLYTSRVILEILGVVDFGIYNIVGGIVVLFSFLNSVMHLSLQRFFSYGIGQKDDLKVAQTYKMAIIIHVYLSIAFLFLSETIGLWFLKTYINIPAERIDIANWVYQFSVFTGIVNILRIPYNALIISYERMSFYAYISIVEVVLKLGSVFILTELPYDKLACYSILIFIISGIITWIYRQYCTKVFYVTSIKAAFNHIIFKNLISFSSWSLLLGVSNIAATQGINVFFNIFCGVILNATMGIANQVNSAVTQFVSSFQTAFNPQLIKFYAASEKEKLYQMLYVCSKFSFLLMLFIAWPIIVNTESILTIWLKNVPENTVSFVKWVLIYGLIDTLINPLAVVVQATGEIKKYQIVCSLFVFLNLPMAIILLYYSFNPVYVFIGRVLINILSLIWRLFYVKNTINITLSDYWKNVLKSIFLIGGISYICMLFVTVQFESLNRLLLSSLFWLLFYLPLIWFLALSKYEQKYLKKISKKFRNKFIHLFDGKI